jgi:hypothetical protein
MTLHLNAKRQLHQNFYENSTNFWPVAPKTNESPLTYTQPTLSLLEHSSSPCALENTPKRLCRATQNGSVWEGLSSAHGPDVSSYSPTQTSLSWPARQPSFFRTKRTERKWSPNPNADPAMPTCAPSFAGDQPSSASLQLSLTGLTRPPCAQSRSTTKLWKSVTSSSGNCFDTPASYLGDLQRPDSTLTRLATGPFAQEMQCPFSSWSTHQQKS